MAFESNPSNELNVRAALFESARTGRRILVEYGGEWCKWSRRMESALASPGLSSFIANNFVFLRHDVGPDGSADSSPITLPQMGSVPYFSLVDQDGIVLANQAAESFELLWLYKKASIRRFLEGWAKL